jgi:hypothetical protein
MASEKSIGRAGGKRIWVGSDQGFNVLVVLLHQLESVVGAFTYVVSWANVCLMAFYQFSITMWTVVLHDILL